jgi:hypothetical protein
MAIDTEAFRASLPQTLSILVITPCDDGHKLCFWNSLRAFEKRPDPAGHRYEVLTPPGDSLIPRARNNYNHTFYFGTDFDYLLWLDSDLDFRPEDVWQLVSHRLPIVAGLYAVKERERRWCLNSIPTEQPDAATGLQRVACAGTGALLYHRSVITAMIAAAETWPHWRVKYIDDHTRGERFHLFHHGVIHDPQEFSHSPRDMSEDWSWCYFARKLGYDIMLDTRCVFLHRGEIDYPLDARRLTEAEVNSGKINQPDGSTTLAENAVPV